MAIVIINGTIVNHDEILSANLRIENEKITEIGDLKPQKGDRVIDAAGKYLFPGMVDVHTHLDLDTGTTKTADDFTSGTKAAIAGGTTTIVDFATQVKGKSLNHALNEWQKKADIGTYCDYGFHMAITDWEENTVSEMKDMLKAGVSSFKMYMAYKNTLQVDDMSIYQALTAVKSMGALIGFHCENGDLVAAKTKALLEGKKNSPFYHPVSRPDTVEEEAIFRLCEIALLADAPIWIVHLSTEKGLRIIEQMKAKGLDILTESCPQYLLLDESRYGSENGQSFEGAKYVMSPPLRKNTDNHALWKGLGQGTIDIISTDHCSFRWKGQKELGRNDFSKIPNGAPGLEHRLLLLYSYGVAQKHISLSRMVQTLSYTPAKKFGLANKGSISPGKDADIVVFDPSGTGKLTASAQIQNTDYTPYEGMSVSGRIERVLLRGRELYTDGRFTETTSPEQPIGKFQRRSTYL